MRFFPILLILLSAGNATAQPAEYRISREEYIDKYKDEAIKEMHAHGIPASITLAQGILESADGNSPLARYANNHFGIKCHSGWKGATFYQDDDAKNECFRKYYDVYDSYRDHSLFLTTRSRYAFLFDLKPTDYKGWALGLKKAGYATHPKYAQMLIELIEANRLYEFDRLNEIPVKRQKEQVAQRKVKTVKAPRSISYNNDIKYIIVKAGDTPAKIADDFEMGLWQIYKYNDLSKNSVLREGDILYLQPKRGKAKTEYHIVKKGETVYSISQHHGIKLRKLYQYNNISPDKTLQPGVKLYLRKRKRL